MKIWFSVSIAALLLASPQAYAEQKTTMHLLTNTGVGEEVGWVKMRDTEQGLELQVKLEGLTPGDHGFHAHQNPSCGPSTKDGMPVPGGAAGSHYDPAGTGHHQGPDGNGHQGDLPKLTAGENGKVEVKALAPRLTEATMSGRAFIVHAGGDNYADLPKALGGGGARVLCGVVGQ